MKALFLSFLMSCHLMAACTICSEGYRNGVYDIGFGLQGIGLQAFLSCEGHLECGYCYPWVDLHEIQLLL